MEIENQTKRSRRTQRPGRTKGGGHHGSFQMLGSQVDGEGGRGKFDRGAMLAWSHKKAKCRRRVRCRCWCRRYGLYAILGAVPCNSSFPVPRLGAGISIVNGQSHVSPQAGDRVRRGQENLVGLMCAGM